MDKITLQEAKELLLIDKFNLDDEAVLQSQMFSDIGEQSAEANSRLDWAKENLSRVDAEVAKKLRINADTEGSKLSEAKLQELVKLDETHKDAFKEYADAKMMAEKWESMKQSFTQRNYMLKELCGLFYAQYFTKESININPAAADYQNGINRQKLAENRNRNKNA